MIFAESKFSIVYYIFTINVVFDIITGFLPKAGTLAIIRAIVLYSIIFYYLIKYRKRKSPNIYIPILFVYFLILTFFSSEQFLTIKVFLQVFASLLMFPIGYHLVKNINILQKFNKDIVRVALLLILNTIISTIAGYGYSYSNKQLLATGNVVGHTLLVLIYVVLIIYFLILSENFSKKRKIFLMLVLFALITIAIFSLVRTIMLSIIIGLFIFEYFKIKKELIVAFMKYLFLFSIVLILLSSFGNSLYNIFNEQFSIRSNRFSNETVTSELRYEETLMVWWKVLSFQKPLTSFFGEELFNTVGNYSMPHYAKWTFAKRQLHVDFNNIVFGSGLVGLFLYLSMYVKIFRQFYYKNKVFFKEDYSFFYLKPLFYSFFFLSIFISFSGQMYGITFRTINFFYMGAILGIVNNKFGDLTIRNTA